MHLGERENVVVVSAVGCAAAVVVGCDWRKEVTNLTSPMREAFNGKGVGC